MRNKHFIPIWLLLCFIAVSPLIAQNNTCGPEEVADPDDFEGTVYFNYGSTARSKSNTYKTAFAVGQTFTGFTESIQHNTALGFYSRFFLPPFALRVTATQGDLLDRIQVNWQIDALGPAPGDGFNIYRDGIFLATVGPNIRSYNDFNVIAGQPYTYCIRGLNLFGEGAAGCSIGFQVPNGTVTGWISTANGSPVPDASVMLTPMQGFSAQFEDGDGAFAIADTAHPFLPETGEDWSIAFWIKTDTAGANSGKLIGMPGLTIRSRPSTGGNEGIAVATTPTGTALIAVNFPNNPNGWHHVALTFDGNSSKARLYFDGVLAGITPLSPVASPDELNFGERIAAGLWEGHMDEVRIYHRQLDELDFDFVMEGTASSGTPHLAYYWKMDEELGEKSYDIIHRNKLYFCGAEFDADRPDVHTAGMTNDDGYYRIESASYGTGTTFLATPSKNFYMHRALKFEKSEFDIAYLPDFGLTPKATIEVWLNNAGPNGTQGILIKNLGNTTFTVELEENGVDNNINVQLNGVTHTYGLLGSGYKHLAFTWDSTTNTIKGYKNGVLLNTFSYPPVTGQWSGHGPWVLGYSGNLTNTFDGLIDEIAFYDTTLSIARIQSHFQNARDIQERGLRVYFAMDEGSGTTINNTGSLLLPAGNTFTTEWSPLAAHQEITPHIFTPVTRQVTLNPSVTSVDQVDFTDRSTIGVTGYVRYQNTDCFAANVEILVNGQSFNPQIFTDSTGRFVIDFDPGTTATLTPTFEDHVFFPASWQVTNVSTPIAGIVFNDLTTRSITGIVAGGLCELPIIDNPGTPQGTVCRIKVSSFDGCFEKTITIDNEAGDFTFNNLPPLERMTIAVIEHSDDSIKTAFDVQGGSVVDISKEDIEIDFIYRAPPQLEFTGLDPFSPTCDMIVLEQEESAELQIRLKEVYIPGGNCYLDTALFRIINGLADEVVDTAMGGGMLVYEFKAGSPNPSPPYLKTLQVIGTTLDGQEASAFEQAIITGAIAKEQTFATILPETPSLILRDPPGDGSYSYLEKNEKFCQKLSFFTEVTEGLGGTGVIDVGPDLTIPFFFGAPDQTFVSIVGVNTTMITSTQQVDEHSIEVCSSLSERISTSADDLIVGSERGGDVYVGGALNVEFGFVDIVTFDADSCHAEGSTTTMVAPGNYATTFIYSEFYILGTVIPYLEALAEDATDTAEQQSYLQSIERWNTIVENNIAQKETAEFIRNISFDAGTNYEYSETSDTAIAATTVHTEIKMLQDEFNALFYLLGIGGGYTVITEYEDVTGQSEDGTTENGVTTGYVLSDDDPLDAFTIDVGMDSVYKTPVFNLKAGQSSCPWEPGTANREWPNMNPAPGYPTAVVNVPANEAAVFKLNIGNQSGTNERWTYALAAVHGNNPDGAIIKYNGKVLDIVPDFQIDHGASQEVTLTIERGPVEYDYDSLLVGAISLCEWERNNALSIPVDSDPKFFAGQYLSVHFLRPCSEVGINVPQQDWVIFPDPLTDPIVDDNILRITVSGYNLNEPFFQSARLQYRPSDGDGAWINIPDTSERYNQNWVGFDTLPGNPPKLGPVFTQFYWQTFGLKDGPYEIRAVAVCTGDATNAPGYSQIIKGRIDREPPGLVGVPQPSDGVLHVGDEISFTFNQPVNCHDFLQNPLNARLYNGNTPLGEEATCVDNKIVIVATDQNGFLENQLLRAELHNVEDLTGNVLLETDWEFYVDRNELAWLTDSSGITKYEDETKSTTVKIHNRGGYPVEFTIEDVPAWVHVTPDAGTLVPNEIRDLQFTAADTLPPGWLTDEIILRTTPGQNGFMMGGDEILPFSVRTLCRPPAWEVNPENYQMTMTLITRIRFNNVFSADPEDMVAAFIDGELRGVAKLIQVPPANNWIAFVTIYGNTADLGKLVTYEIFDASACLRYPGFFENAPFNFSSNGTQGTPGNPRVLSDNGTLVDDIPLHKGWNWISFNLGFPDSTINSALGQINNPTGDLVKDQNAFSVFNNNTWTGSLSEVTNTSLYMYQANQPNTIRMTGTALEPLLESIPVVAGWNWIGYIPTYRLPVSTALSTLPATAGDIIKSQTAFAQYVNSTVKWVGNLTHLEAPNGYLLRTASPGTLKYPSQSITGNDPPLVRNPSSMLWNVDATRYEHSMTLIGAFQNDEINATTSAMELGAFVGDELRGSGEAIFIEYLDSYVFFLTCFANTHGEQLHFKLYDASTGDVQSLKEKMTFIPHQHQGSVEVPVPFSLQATGIGDVHSDLAFNVQPNPFHDETVCHIEVPNAQHVDVMITDADGKQVYYTRLQANAGMNSFVWKGCSTSGSPLSSGIYFIRLKAEQGVLTKKVMLQR